MSSGEQIVRGSQSLPRRSQVYYELLGYLTKHPQAQDTLEGIVEWWLLEQRITRATRQVKVALAQLVAERLVIAREGATGQVYYRVNRQKLRDIRRLLKA